MPPQNGTTNHTEITYDVIVIGGGFAGSFTALELLKKDYKVLHIDKDNSILGVSSSSYNECYKLHTGVHYLGDLETARQCLLDSIEFAKEFPLFIQGEPHDPWRKGRHYVVSNSLFDAKDLCANLQKLYTEKVAEDADNAVFGDPKDFIKYLSPEEYPYVATKIPYLTDSYTFDVMYDIIPSNDTIKPNKLYLYLDRGLLKFKALNKEGEIEEFLIDEEDPELDSIKSILASRSKNDIANGIEFAPPPQLTIATLEDKLQQTHQNLIHDGEKELTPTQKKLLYHYTRKRNPAFCEIGTTENIHVKLGIETPESQIDINKLRTYLQAELASYPNYTFMPNSEVKHLSFEQGTLNYTVETYPPKGKEGSKKIYKSAGIVNCAWNNIETLDRELGYVAQDATTFITASGERQTIKNDRIIRIKISLLVTLPDSLKNVNTCIFSCGPHMSFTNLGNRTAVITYEPVTNAGTYPAGTVILNEELQALYKEKLVPDSGKGQEFAQKIMEGASHYLPDLKHPDCKVEEVRLGHVKIFVKSGKNLSLSDKDSAIHSRTEDGVEEKGLCYLSHSGMKMTYTKKGAETVASKFEDHFYARKKLLERARKPLKPVQTVVDSLAQKKIPHFYNLILYNICRNLLVQTTEKIVTKTFNMKGSDSPRLPSEIDRIEKETRKAVTALIEQKTQLNENIDKLRLQSLNKPDKCLKPSQVKGLLSIS